MSDDFDDYPVDPLSDEQIEKIADGWRVALDMFDDFKLDVFAFVRKAVAADFREVRGLEIVIQPDDLMGGRDAYTTSVPPRIFFAKSKHDGAKRGNPRDRMTLMHEFFHACKHKGAAPKARMALGNKTANHIAPYKSAERQARRFAGAILMPRHIVLKARSALQLAEICNVSIQAAEIRFKEFGPKEPRVTPREVLSFLGKTNERTSGERQALLKGTESKTSEVDRLWNLGHPISGWDENVYRESHGGHCIEKSRYRFLGELGWYERDGRIVAWSETSSYF